MANPESVESQADLPKGWSSAEHSANYAVTLLVFSWALLPAGFMLLFLVTGRYPDLRMPLAAMTMALLAFTFVTGYGQRQSAMRDGRVLLCATMMGTAGGVVGLVWAMDLTAWWWAAYASVLGCVPMLFVAMNHLASCTAPAIERPWHATHRLASDALPGWTIISGSWTPSEMAWTLRDSKLFVMFGRLEGEQTRLRIEAFAKGPSFPIALLSDMRWEAMKAQGGASEEEE